LVEVVQAVLLMEGEQQEQDQLLDIYLQMVAAVVVLLILDL
jgi:hypothetical protein